MKDVDNMKKAASSALSSSGFKTLTISDGAEHLGITVGVSTFKDCKSLYSVNITSPDTQIDEHAFDGCYNLESVTKWYELNSMP